MYHVKHLRKVNYDKINKDKTWAQVISLRNRRKIPVCRDCYFNVIQINKYEAVPLKEKPIDKMCDNTMVNVESYVHKNRLIVNYAKSLLKRGLIKEK